MIGSALLWLWTLFAAVWTLNWVKHRHISRGHFWAIVEVVIYWSLAGYFFSHPEVSRMNLLWAGPVTFLGAFFASVVIGRAVDRD